MGLGPLFLRIKKERSKNCYALRLEQDKGTDSIIMQ